MRRLPQSILPHSGSCDLPVRLIPRLLSRMEVKCGWSFCKIKNIILSVAVCSCLTVYSLVDCGNILAGMETKQGLCFEFAWPWSSWLPWSTVSRVCGQLSSRQGQGQAAALVGAHSVSVCVCRWPNMHVYCTCVRCTHMILPCVPWQFMIALQ